MEQLEYNLLFRWFVRLNMYDAVGMPRPSARTGTACCGEIAEELFAAVLELAGTKEWLSDEHFTVDGTMFEGWANLKSFQPKKKSAPGKDDKPDGGKSDG